jgi:hypothetical protein
MNKKIYILLVIMLALFAYRISLLPEIWEKGQLYGISAEKYSFGVLAEAFLIIPIVFLAWLPRAVRPIVILSIPLWLVNTYWRFIEDSDIIRLILSSGFGLCLLVFLFFAAPNSLKRKTSNNLMERNAE